MTNSVTGSRHAELVRQLLGIEVAVALVLQAADGDHHVDHGIAQDAPQQRRTIKGGNGFRLGFGQAHDAGVVAFGLGKFRRVDRDFRR